MDAEPISLSRASSVLSDVPGKFRAEACLPSELSSTDDSAQNAARLQRMRALPLPRCPRRFPPAPPKKARPSRRRIPSR
jgi:hypothetical protein